ncbi:MAG: MutS-related protein [Dysgonomonas sp.]
MNIEDIKLAYQDIIDKESITHSQLNKNVFRVGMVRLAVVIGCLAACYILWGNVWNVITAILISVLVFIILMVFHNRLFWKRLYSETKIKNAENELKALDYDFSVFDGAAEFSNPEHSFSIDLDLFGNRSFFQSMNRTVTSFGKEVLANTLLYPFEDKKEIHAQQEAVKELSGKTGLTTHFRTVGQMTDKDSFNVTELAASISRKPHFYKNTLWTIVSYLLPCLYIAWIVAYAFGAISGESFMYLWLGTLLVSSIPLKRISKMLNMFEKKTAVLDKYSRLFAIIENEEFKSPLLKECQEQVKIPEKASYAIKKLKSLQENLSMSVTFPIFLLLNPIFAWDIRYAAKMEKWALRHKGDLAKWFDAVARFDATVSAAIFAYNHPDYTYPEVADTFVFEGKALGHPMIHRNLCVRNDVNIGKQPYFLVITGANMAGKSTYLRTIGINHTLACAGMPVCAEQLSFYPGRLVTNLRTADSLADNESYFFAELKRLKMIIDRLQTGEPLFIILDEILKGTNSEDKQKGSLALMRQLVDLKGVGIIATHDLVLGNLEKEYPDNVKDYCFEAEIKDDHLSFSYKMKEGIAQNMNACFLMKKMGITGL